MPKFIITLKDQTEYIIDNVETAKEAEELASEWWSERAPETKVTEIPETKAQYDVEQAITQIFQSDNADAKYEAFAAAFFESIETDDEPYDKSGYHMLKAIKDNNLDAFLIAACGWSAESLMKKACLMHDHDAVFHQDKEEAVFISVWDNNVEVKSPCRVNMQTFEVTKTKPVKDLFNILQGEYVEFNGTRYPVRRKEELEENDIVTFWYNTMEAVLKENNADNIKDTHWVIKNSEKNWELHIRKNVKRLDSSWLWKVDTQYFSKEDWAIKYLLKLINEKNTGIRIIDRPKGIVPVICGVNGTACRAPGKCNTMICSDCPVAEEFFAKRDGVTLQYQE